MVLQFIDKDEFIRILDKPTLTQQDIFRFFSNFSTKPHILYEGAIFLRKFNIKN